MKFDIKILFNSIIDASIIIMVFLGLFVRLYITKNCNFYHIDDYLLLSNVINSSYPDLLTKHLEEGQVSPPLFVIMLKFIYSYFGLNHQTLALVGGGNKFFFDSDIYANYCI